MGRRLTKDKFITKAKAVHGGKYDYSLVEINGNNKTKVAIKCNKCGTIFKQEINSHLHGHGCYKCVKNARTKTTEEFIAEAVSAHGNKYIYDKVIYTGSNKKITIICPIHGEFEMIANNHTSLKQGCPNCAKERRKDAVKKVLTMTTDEFIAKARDIHRDKYDYSLVEINGNNKTKVTIKCNTCGTVFEQRIDCHLHGGGCSVCAKERHKKLLTDTKEGFIEKARKIHGNEYNYDKVEYVNDKTPVIITCHKHGDFQMKPCYHKAGCGCQKCKQSHLEEQTRLWLEKNNVVFEPQKTFPWLRNKREMPLDFYLPEYNIAIECQGEQHYKANGKFFTENKVGIIKQRDTLKYNLCKEHGIPVCYIKYDEDVKERLNEILKSVT